MQISSLRPYSGPSFVGANFKTATKLDTQLKQIKDYIRAIKEGDAPNGLFIFAPTQSILKTVADLVKDVPQIKLAAQTVHPTFSKENTGTVLSEHLKELGISYSLVGHLEERKKIRDLASPAKDSKIISQIENEEMAKKVQSLVKAGIAPIICIGDVLEEKNDVKNVVKAQLFAATKLIAKEDIQKLIDKGLTPAIAYEPAWAIGAMAASPTLAEDVCKHIRSLVIEKFGADIATKVAILYGGSVSPDNIQSFAKMSNIDGALVGGASYGNVPSTFSPKIFAISRLNALAK